MTPAPRLTPPAIPDDADVIVVAPAGLPAVPMWSRRPLALAAAAAIADAGYGHSPCAVPVASLVASLSSFDKVNAAVA